MKFERLKQLREDEQEAWKNLCIEFLKVIGEDLGGDIKFAELINLMTIWAKKHVEFYMCDGKNKDAFQ